MSLLCHLFIHLNLFYFLLLEIKKLKFSNFILFFVIYRNVPLKVATKGHHIQQLLWRNLIYNFTLSELDWLRDLIIIHLIHIHLNFDFVDICQISNLLLFLIVQFFLQKIEVIIINFLDLNLLHFLHYA